MAGMNPDPGVSLTPGDYFVLSRLDGSSSVHTISTMVGQSDAAVAEVLVRLVAAGCAEVAGIQRDEALAALEGAPAPPPVTSSPTPSEFKREASWKRADDYRQVGMRGETSGMYGMATSDDAPKRRAKSESKAPDLSRELIPEGWPVPFDQFTFDPVAMAGGEAMSTVQKQVVMYYHFHLRRVSYYRLFGVEESANRREIKAAYFRLSKAFHPDRWFRRDVGEFGARIEEIFKWLNRAYSVLGSPRKRKGYSQLLKRGYIGEWQLERGGGPAPRKPGGSPKAPASSRTEQRRTTGVLAARARQAEASGEFDKAVDLYERALQVTPTPELRIRLVECMLKAHVEPQAIEQHLVAARDEGGEPKDVLLLEATVARRLNQLDRAISCYLAVLEIEPDNPVAKLGVSGLTGHE